MLSRRKRKEISRLPTKIFTKLMSFIVFNNPDDFDLKFKSSAIREKKLFTLDSRQVPMLSICKGDNGAYVSKRCAKNTLLTIRIAVERYIKNPSVTGLF